jgi:hypothetical protein
MSEAQTPRIQRAGLARSVLLALAAAFVAGPAWMGALGQARAVTITVLATDACLIFLIVCRAAASSAYRREPRSPLARALVWLHDSLAGLLVYTFWTSVRTFIIVLATFGRRSRSAQDAENLDRWWGGSERSEAPFDEENGGHRARR